MSALRDKIAAKTPPRLTSMGRAATPAPTSGIHLSRSQLECYAIRQSLLTMADALNAAFAQLELIERREGDVVLERPMVLNSPHRSQVRRIADTLLVEQTHGRKKAKTRQRKHR